jgi:hypothetical protein
MARFLLVLTMILGFSTFAKADNGRSLGWKIIHLIAPLENIDPIELREGPNFLIDTQYDESNIPYWLLYERLHEVAGPNHDCSIHGEITREMLGE